MKVVHGDQEFFGELKMYLRKVWDEHISRDILCAVTVGSSYWALASADCILTPTCTLALKKKKPI
jgi:hypothetical protein